MLRATSEQSACSTVFRKRSSSALVPNPASQFARFFSLLLYSFVHVSLVKFGCADTFTIEGYVLRMLSILQISSDEAVMLLR